MKFKFYISDPYYGGLVGTNNEEEAERLSYLDEFYVLNTENGTWLREGEGDSIDELGE